MIWQKDEEHSEHGNGLHILNSTEQAAGIPTTTAGGSPALGPTDSEHGVGSEDQAVSRGAAAQEQQQQHWQRQEQRYYYLLTYGLLVVMVLCAIIVPNIWAALSAIGDLASTIQAFIVPGIIAVVLSIRSPAALNKQQQQHTAASDADVADVADHDLLLRGGVGQQHLVLPADSSEERTTLLTAVDERKPVASFAEHLSRESSCRSPGCCSSLLLHWQRDSNLAGWLFGKVLYGFVGSFVVALGAALFANGVYQRL
jgi:hypothetical protein